MTWIYILLGLEIALVLVVGFFLLKKIRDVILERKNRKRNTF